MDYGQVAVVLQGDLTLEQSKSRLTDLVVRKSPSVPHPVGRVGQDFYWLSADVKQWVADHAELVGASKKDLIRATRAARSNSVAKGRSRRGTNPKNSR
jgi:hypothetical protein